MIPYGRQTIDEDDVAAVTAALRSPNLTQGPLVEEFERNFAEYVGGVHAVAVCNATAALHLAMRVAGISPGERVITSPITFLASANAAAYVGAIPDFADIDPISRTLSPEALANAWSDDVRAVVAVDFAGQPADLPEIARVARARGAVVIDDACHAAGGAFHVGGEGRIWKIGGNPWADITVFSFHPVKTLTTGEGGMLVTNNAGWAERARRLRAHGIVRDPAHFESSPFEGALAERGPWYYEMQELGYNYRLTDLQCALGLSQLRKLPGFAARRRAIVASYNEAFRKLPHVSCPTLRDDRDRETTSWHLYTLEIDFGAMHKSRSEVMAALRECGVGSQVLYVPVYLQPWYRRTFGYAAGKCPQAERFYRGALSLPLFPGLSDSDVARVIAAVTEVLDPACVP